MLNLYIFTIATVLVQKEKKEWEFKNSQDTVWNNFNVMEGCSRNLR